MRLLIAAVAAIVFTLPAVAGDVALTGENTKITFVGTKPGGKHEGGFKTLKGAAVVSGDALSKVAVEIDMDMILGDRDAGPIAEGVLQVFHEDAGQHGRGEADHLDTGQVQ